MDSVICTQSVMARALQDKGYARFAKESLERFCQWDWGNTCKEDQEYQNEELRKDPDTSCLASYEHPEYGRLWIHSTYGWDTITLLLPEEY